MVMVLIGSCYEKETVSEGPKTIVPSICRQGNTLVPHLGTSQAFLPTALWQAGHLFLVRILLGGFPLAWGRTGRGLGITLLVSM